MNWVGGARSRVKVKQEKKLQQEFFERKRQERKAKRSYPLGMPDGNGGKEEKLSQDLISLHTIMKTHDRSKSIKMGNSTNDTQRKPTYINMETCTPGRFTHNMDLGPSSPGHKSSRIDLDSPSNGTYHSRTDEQADMQTTDLLVDPVTQKEGSEDKILKRNKQATTEDRNKPTKNLLLEKVKAVENSSMDTSMKRMKRAVEETSKRSHYARLDKENQKRRMFTGSLSPDMGSTITNSAFDCNNLDPKFNTVHGNTNFGPRTIFSMTNTTANQRISDTTDQNIINLQASPPRNISSQNRTSNRDFFTSYTESLIRHKVPNFEHQPSPMSVLKDPLMIMKDLKVTDDHRGVGNSIQKVILSNNQNLESNITSKRFVETEIDNSVSSGVHRMYLDENQIMTENRKNCVKRNYDVRQHLLQRKLNFQPLQPRTKISLEQDEAPKEISFSSASYSSTFGAEEETFIGMSSYLSAFEDDPTSEDGKKTTLQSTNSCSVFETRQDDNAKLPITSISRMDHSVLTFSDVRSQQTSIIERQQKLPQKEKQQSQCHAKYDVYELFLSNPLQQMSDITSPKRDQRSVVTGSYARQGNQKDEEDNQISTECKDVNINHPENDTQNDIDAESKNPNSGLSYDVHDAVSEILDLEDNIYPEPCSQMSSLSGSHQKEERQKPGHFCEEMEIRQSTEDVSIGQARSPTFAKLYPSQLTKGTTHPTHSLITRCQVSPEHQKRSGMKLWREYLRPAQGFLAVTESNSVGTRIKSRSLSDLITVKSLENVAESSNNRFTAAAGICTENKSCNTFVTNIDKGTQTEQVSSADKCRGHHSIGTDTEGLNLKMSESVQTDFGLQSRQNQSHTTATNYLTTTKTTVYYYIPNSSGTVDQDDSSISTSASFTHGNSTPEDAEARMSELLSQLTEKDNVILYQQLLLKSVKGL